MRFFRYRGRVVRVVILFFRVLLSYKLFAIRNIFTPATIRRELMKRQHSQMARMIRERMVRMRGILIKIGQFFSSRVDILPEEYTDELSKLQDQVPPAPFSDIVRRLTEELGPMDEIFSAFTEIPIASASLGQVHRACLRDGDCIVVKVQYPGIDEVIAADMRALKYIIRILRVLYRQINLDVIYSEFSRIVAEELDYLLEGKNAETFARNFAKNERIKIPIVYWPYTTSKVLTLEYLEGTKITDLAEIDRLGIDKKETAHILAEAYAQMFFVDGFFHGDPHPGTIFVRSGPSVILVDFGMVDRISARKKEELRRAFIAIVERDSLGLVRALVDMGFIPLTKDIQPLVVFVDRLLQKYRDISPGEFKAMDIEEIGRDIQQAVQLNPAIQIPNDFILLGRVVGMLNGLGSQLDPQTNIIEISAPYAKRFIQSEEMSAQGALKQVAGAARSLVKLPKMLHDLLVTTSRGELRVEIGSRDIVGVLRHIHNIGRAFVLAMFSAGAAAAAVAFRISGYDTDARWSAGASGILLLAAVYFMRKLRQRD
jgi:predicted unusual protein kinase regulating ubiquinone biosynthesis (AarF/ABC1/UbiB family)